MAKSAQQAPTKKKRVHRRMGLHSANARRTGAGVIRPEELYTLEEAEVRLEQGPKTLRDAFRQGLPSMFFGKRKYVKGSDLIEFLEKYKVHPGRSRASLMEAAGVDEEDDD